MNTVDWVVEEHGVIAGPVLWIRLRLVSNLDTPRDQELAVEAVDLFPAAGPQRNMIDAHGLLGMGQLSSGPGRLHTDVAVQIEMLSHVVNRLVLHVQR